MDASCRTHMVVDIEVRDREDFAFAIHPHRPHRHSGPLPPVSLAAPLPTNERLCAEHSVTGYHGNEKKKVGMEINILDMWADLFFKNRKYILEKYLPNGPAPKACLTDRQLDTHVHKQNKTHLHHHSKSNNTHPKPMQKRNRASNNPTHHSSPSSSPSETAPPSSYPFPSSSSLDPNPFPTPLSSS